MEGNEGPLAPGDVIARCRIVEPIGAGAFAHVYKCQHEITHQFSALKVLLPTRVSNPKAVDSFLQEGRALANIDHPHILRVYDVGTEAGVVFMRMALLRGSTLGDCLRAQGRLSVPLALHLFVQLCTALAEVHHHEMVHRDIKPQNIVIESAKDDDNVRLIIFDFGVSKVHGSAVATTDRLQTLRGSFAYMAPEALGSETPTPLFDIYAAGIVLFEMLTGRHPRQELLHDPSELGQVTMVSDPPNIRHFVTDLSEDVAILLDKTLARRPNQRFQSAREVGQAAELALIRFGQDVVSGRRRYVQPQLEAELFEYRPGEPAVDPTLWDAKQSSIPLYDRSMAAEVMASAAQHAPRTRSTSVPVVSSKALASSAPSVASSVPSINGMQSTANTASMAERPSSRRTVRLTPVTLPEQPAVSAYGAKRWLVVPMLLVAASIGSAAAWLVTSRSPSARASSIATSPSAPSSEAAPSVSNGSAQTAQPSSTTELPEPPATASPTQSTQPSATTTAPPATSSSVKTTQPSARSATPPAASPPSPTSHGKVATPKPTASFQILSPVPPY